MTAKCLLFLLPYNFICKSSPSVARPDRNSKPSLYTTKKYDTPCIIAPIIRATLKNSSTPFPFTIYTNFSLQHSQNPSVGFLHASLDKNRTRFSACIIIRSAIRHQHKDQIMPGYV